MFYYMFQFILIALFLLVHQLLMVASLLQITADPPIAKPGCQDVYGNVSIPYPFGIGDDCYHSLPYAVICNTSLLHPKLILSKFNLEVAQISLNSQNSITLDAHNLVAKTHLQKTCSIQDVNISSIDLGGTPYLFSGDFNSLIVGGCGSSTLLLDRSNKILGGCATACDKVHMITNKCTGRGCCSIDLPSSFEFYRLNISNFGNGCTNTMLISRTSIENVVINPSLSEFAVVSTVLEWAFRNTTFSDNLNKYCYSVASPPGNYVCYCKNGYYGNPYLPYEYFNGNCM